MVFYEKDFLFTEGFHIAEWVYGSGEKNKLHSHDFYELMLITKGQVIHFINGKVENLDEGSLCLIFPEDSHCIYNKNDSSCSFINLAFSAETFKLVNSIYSSYAQMSSDKKTVLLPALLRESLRYKLLYPSSGHASLFKVSRREIFIGVLIDCLCFLRGQGLGGADVPAWLTGACEAMLKDRNYVRGIKQFVKLSGKTQEHLTRSMKRFYNLTPTSYINSIRLTEAARLLYVSKLNILDIQNECGFPNASHFNMLFKAEFGISPSRYRRLTTQPF